MSESGVLHQIARLEFRSELVRVVRLGERDQTMTLYTRGDGHGLIEWIAGDEDAHIGLIFEGKKVTDYDGVFDLPMQAAKLLEASGYDCSGVV